MTEIKPKTSKTNFAWASIAGADPEPVELIDIDSRKGLYTIGCADPFWLDDDSAGIVVYTGSPLERPKNPETQEQRDLREKKYRAKEVAVTAAYEWHRDNAKHGPDCALAGCTGKDREYRHGWRGPR
jgi:hypothetical protein